jgi:hypothetical protein
MVWPWGRFPTCPDSENTTGNQAFGESVVTGFDTSDPDLVKVIEAWPTLSEPIGCQYKVPDTFYSPNFRHFFHRIDCSREFLDNAGGDTRETTIGAEKCKST